MKRIVNGIKIRIWEQGHKKWCKKLRSRFVGKAPTILSCNCLGGIIYHDLGLQFTSPTINLYMSCPDFIKFLENLDYYLDLTITPYTGSIKRDYPLGLLGDLLLFLGHYNSVEEANQKWQLRKKRMNRDNIFVLASDRDGFSEDLLPRFNELPYKKILFTHLPIDNPDCFYIRGYEEEGQVGELMAPAKDGKRIIDQFDYIAWFNGEI